MLSYHLITDAKGETLEAGALAGRVALVTGAGRGIGAACAVALGAAGAEVVVADLDGQTAAEIAGLILASGGRATPEAVDVTAWSDVHALCARIVERNGSIDIAIANAGIGDYSSLHDGDPQRWRRVIDINLLGVLHTVRGVYEHMVRCRRGHIVLMASIAGRRTWIGEPVYIATKWGVVGLGWALQKEAAEHGVRVTMIEPGMVDTPLVRSTSEGRDELDRFAALSADDVARAVVFAASQPDDVAVTEIVVQPVGPEL